jgi:hypothetical protein
MTDRQLPARAGALALVAAAAFVVQPAIASAQAAPPPPPATAPTPPSPQSAPQGGYDDNAWADQRNYQAYREQYAAWAEQNCVTQRSHNIATGALVGGVAGALLAGGIAGWAAGGAWVLFGGSLGLGAGALVGATTTAPGCPEGYAVRAGAPPFDYSGPVYGYRPAYSYGPSYRPYYPAYRPSYPAYGAQYGYRGNGGWYWDGYRWVRRPYYAPQPYSYGSY